MHAGLVTPIISDVLEFTYISKYIHQLWVQYLLYIIDHEFVYTLNFKSTGTNDSALDRYFGHSVTCYIIH